MAVAGALGAPVRGLAPRGQPGALAYTYNVSSGQTETVSDSLKDKDVTGVPDSLSKYGEGTLVLNGNNSFTGGTYLDGGTIVLGHDKALGEWVGGTLGGTTQQGLVTVYGAGKSGVIAIKEDRTIRNNFQIGTFGVRTGALTFAIDAGKTLTISGVSADKPSSYSDGGGAISVSSPGRGSLTFTGNGSLVLSGNSTSGDGGAVGAMNYTGQEVVLDFRGLSSLTVSGNTAGSVGGGLYAHANSSSMVILGDNTILSGNTANGVGGAINASTSFGTGASSVVTLGAKAVLSDNIAVLGGGGIYALSASSTVTLGNGAVLSGNIARDPFGRGGALYVESRSGPAEVALGSHAYVTGNCAGVNNEGGAGGGLYITSSTSPASLKLYGHTLLSGNIVSGKDGGTPADSRGGAVYIGGGADSLLMLNTEIVTSSIVDDVNDYDGTGKYAPIAFSGNRVGVDTADPQNIDPSTGTANAVFLNGNTQLRLSGDGNIYFDDPIASANGGNSLSKDDKGFVQFVGTNTLDATGYTSGVPVEIESGTFRVVNDPVAGEAFTVTGPSQAFFLHADASLAGQGKVGADGTLFFEGTLSPDGDRFEIPAFLSAGGKNSFLHAGRDTVLWNKRFGTLTLGGPVIFNAATLAVDLGEANKVDLVAIDGSLTTPGGNAVDLQSWEVVSNATILTATSGINASDFSSPTLLGNALPATGRMISASLDADIGGTALHLTTTQDDNKRLLWTGGTGLWDMTMQNWKDKFDAQVNFIARDFVVFDATGQGTVTVQGDAQVVSGMYITGGTYTFHGGKIIGVNSAQILDWGTATGQLTVSGGETTLMIATEFEKGTYLTGGTLILGHDQALGVWQASDMESMSSTTGLVTVFSTGTIKLTDDRTIRNHFNIGSKYYASGSLTFAIDQDQTLTIAGVENTSTDIVGGAISLYVPGTDGLKFTGNGSLVMVDNSARAQGGAIGVWISGADKAANLDLSSLSSVDLSGNASSQGGAVYVKSTTSPTVTFGDHATLSGNVADIFGASSLGGAVYVGGSVGATKVTFGDYAVVSGNIAGNSGYGHHGGGIAIESTNASLTDSSAEAMLSIGNYATLSGNIAGKGGHGGGIYGHASSDVGAATLKLSLGDHATLSGNSAGSGGGGRGGGIYATSAGAGSLASTVTLGNYALLSDNIAGNGGEGRGGGIYASSSGDSPASPSAASTVALGNHAVLSGNIAGKGGNGYGGGIYASSSIAARVTSMVTLGNNAVLTGNIAGNSNFGEGGGIYADAASTTAVGSYAYLANNRAGGNNQGGRGGVFSIAELSASLSTSLSLHGHTLLSGNLVSGGASSRGGALYMEGGAGSSLTLDTEIVNSRIVNDSNEYAGTGQYAPIAFSGNKIDVDTSDLKNLDPSSGTANALYLENNIQLVLKGNGNIYFDDPVSSSDTGGNSLVKHGTGFVQFVGNNVLATYDPNLVDGNSVDIQAGTFRVVNNGQDQSFDASGSGRFHLASGATLAGQGKIQAGRGFLLSGTISPDSDRFAIPTFVTKGDTGNGATSEHYNFFKDDKATTVADDKKGGALTLVGNTTFSGATFVVDSADDTLHVDGVVTFGGSTRSTLVSTLTSPGVYDFLTSSKSIVTNIPLPTLELSGLAEDGYSFTRGSSIGYKQGSSTPTLQLTLSSDKNIPLYWTGATNSTWSTLAADANWTDKPGATATETRFRTGDSVFFADGPTNKNINMGGNPVSVESLKVTGSGYSFNLAAGSVSIIASENISLGDAFLNITGFTPSDPGTSYTDPLGQSLLMRSDNGQVRFNGSVTIDGQATTDFLSATVRTTGDTLVAETALSWNSIDAKRKAHGDFTIAGTFTLGASLANNTSSANWQAGWDGKTLTKKGDGTLILSAVNTYSGKTLVREGTLRLENARAIAASSGLELSAGTRLSAADNTVVGGISAQGAGLELDGGLSVGGPLSLKGSTLSMNVGAGSMVSVAGVASFNGGNANTINLTSWETGRHVLVSASSIAGSLDDFTDVFFKGEKLDATDRRKAVLSLDGTILGVTLSADNQRLSWKGNSAALWNNDKNNKVWQGNYDSFIDGDAVTFGDSGLQHASVLVDSQYGVTVSDMTVTGKGYSFSGGDIRGDASVGNLGGEGKLRLSSGGTTTFANVIGFTGGIEIDKADTLARLTAPGVDLYDSNTISGEGGLAKLGSGSLTLNGSNTYKGETYVKEGTLNGSLPVGASLRLEQNATYNSLNSDRSLGQLSGTGSISMDGYNLTIVNASFSGSINNFNSLSITGRFGGNSTIAGNLDLLSGATLAPGNSVGTMRIESLNQRAGSTFEVELNDTSADKVIITKGGALIETGAKLLVLNENKGATWETDRRYTIIEIDAAATGTINQAFSSMNADALPFLDIVQVLSSNGKTLSLDTTYNGKKANDAAHTSNQRDVAESISLLPGGHPVQNAIANASSNSEARRWYDKFSGEIHPSISTALLLHDQSFLRSLRGSAAYAAPQGDEADPRRAVFPIWIAMGGFSSHTDKSNPSAKGRYAGFDLSLGAEARIDEVWRIGGAFRFTDAEYKSYNGRDSEADIQSYSLALYAGRDINVGPGDLRFFLGGSYTWHEIDSERTIRAGAFRDQVKADYSAESAQLSAELGYVFPATEQLNLEPYINLSWNSISRDSFNEKNGPSSLHAKSRTEDNLSTALGLRAALQTTERLSLDLDLSWRHTYGPLRHKSDFRFRQGGTDHFSIKGAPLDQDALGLGLGLSLQLTDTLSIKAGYDGNYGNRSHSHSGDIKAVLEF